MKSDKEKLIKNLYEKKIIAIVRGIDTKYCTFLAEALKKGGINMIEVTFDQKSADHFESTVKAIREIKEKIGTEIFTGAGTVLTKEQVDLAYEAGAQYIITPSVNPEIIRYAKEKELVTMPGALTPTEAEAAYEAGADFVKIFPAGNLGASYIKALKGPLGHIPMLAVGGVNEKNIGEFLKTGIAGVGVGGNLVNREWIETGRFEKITALAKEFVKNAGEA